MGTPTGLLRSLFWRTLVWLVALLWWVGLVWSPLTWLNGGEQAEELRWPVVALALVLTALALVFVTRRLTQPWRTLREATLRLGAGDLDSRLSEDTEAEEVLSVHGGFNRMAQTMARQDKERSLMLAGLSHDLRTPLTRLRLELELSVADEGLRQRLVQEVELLDALIDKFSDYARPGVPGNKAVHLSALVNGELQRWQERGDLRIQAEVVPDLWVWGDAVDLARILQNLLDNVSKHGRPLGHPDAAAPVLLRLTPDAEPNRVRLSLRDWGPGVPAQHLSRLTTPFYREDSARAQTPGSGLGLAVVAKMAQTMGATLSLSSPAQGGLEVSLRLKSAPALG